MHVTTTTGSPIWRKSSLSTAHGQCVEIARLGKNEVGVRDSKRPEAGHLTLSRSAFEEFLAAVAGGEFSIA